MADESKKKAAKPVAKITVAESVKQANAAVKVCEYLETNTGYKPKTVRYCATLLKQWAQSLMVNDAAKSQLADIKKRQKAELKAAEEKIAAATRKSLGID